MMKARKYIAVIFTAMVMGISGCNDDRLMRCKYTAIFNIIILLSEIFYS